MLRQTNDTAVFHNHQQITEEVAKIVAEFREKLLIPPRWQFEIQVMCPQEMAIEYNCAPDDTPQAALRWEYLPNARYRVRVRCDLAGNTLRWVVAHEMLEAMLARYGDFANQMITTQRSRGKQLALTDSHREIRDEIIEWWLAILIPEERPGFGGAASA